VIDRPIRLYCTDKHTHSERELAVLTPVEPRVDLGADRPWPETVEERHGLTAAESLRIVTPGVCATGARVPSAYSKVPAGSS
jgi:hypothetical protein